MTLTNYRNFDLLITRAGERYRAFVMEAPAGEDSARIWDAATGQEVRSLSGHSVEMREQEIILVNFGSHGEVV